MVAAASVMAGGGTTPIPAGRSPRRWWATWPRPARCGSSSCSSSPRLKSHGGDARPVGGGRPVGTLTYNRGSISEAALVRLGELFRRTPAVRVHHHGAEAAAAAVVDVYERLVDRAVE